MGLEGGGAKEDAVPVGFDEAVLRALCDMDVSWRPNSRSSRWPGRNRHAVGAKLTSVWTAFAR